MKTIKVSDDQSMLILFSLRLYAIECDKQALDLRRANNDHASNGEMITITLDRADQARDLSTFISRAEQHD